MTTKVASTWDFQNFPATWRDHATKYRPEEIVAVTNWDEAVACIERGYRVRSARDERDDLQEAFRPIGGRQGHAIPFVPLVAVDPIGDGNDSEAAR